MKTTGEIRHPIVGQVPRGLFFIGVGLLVSGIAWQFSQTPRSVHIPGALLLMCYLGWLLLESPVTFHRGSAKPLDTATLLAYGTSRIGLIATAEVIPIEWHRWSNWLILPFAVFCAGVALRLIAMRTLGQWYSHHVARGAGQQAVTSGPYRFIRHPAYAGMLVANVALTTFFFNVGSALFMAALAAAVVWRLLVEERVLRDMPGYAAYASGKNRLIPMVW
jgi:protein-S-isoprenylcysteine O-methyltransferase Ste14